ncbi:ATP-binding cassette domain-containing protein [Nocardioides plantarum]|uniref:ATP-binding cassette domain-containing protein n=1 Tax=Nocardioides plantarum TaxID=29299 RepID=A0ABV5KFS2_9ACTN|nr:ATP-binding cassette domain-containing protein [Nocardioides plantarum]
MNPDVLRLDRITKTYPGVVALRDVSLTVRSGEVHALVGENGAGKSTLMGVAAGVVSPDTGSVEIGGRPLERPSAGAAQALGLAVVYQHATVLDDLSVAENLLFSVPRDRRPAARQTASWVRDRLADVGTELNPRARAGDLSIAQRQLVEIARALALEARVLVLDEPTESLTANESDLLFEQVDRLREAGTGIVYISHRFPEVRRIADRISVLRDGELRGTFEASDVTEDDVLTLIVGRRVDHVFPPKPEAAATGEPLLSLADLSGSAFAGVDLDVRRGEIVGLAGVEGNGQREVLRAIAGLHPHQGTMTLEGRDVTMRSPAAAARHGIVHLPGDRHVEGAFLPLSVRENVSVLVLDKVSGAGVMRRRDEEALAQQAVTDLGIRTPGVESTMAGLSGGNQQKVLFARSLAAEPEVLLADEPTRGVDVGARAEIYRLLRSYAEAGHAVVVLSTDAVELAGLCDRVLVFSRGRVARELASADLSEREITGAAITAKETRSEEGTAQRRTPWAAWARRSDYLPSMVLTLLIVALAAWTWHSNDLFLSARNLSGSMQLMSILVLVACGQLCVLMVGSIDLSVGPLIGLSVVIMSFYATFDSGTTGLALGVGAAVGAGVAVGVVNALGIRLLGLPPVIATLVVFIFLQGLALVLRPTPDGFLDRSTTDLLQSTWGIYPVVAVLAVVVALVLEWVSRRTRAGVELRAVGSDQTRAARLGARVGVTFVAAHVACSVLAALAGVVLSGVVGVGQAGLGGEYTLTSIAAVVLGGASIFGGRGSFVGALLGAVLIQEVVSATSFLGLDESWQEWLPGLLIIAGAGLFSRARSRSGSETASP